MPPSDMPPSDGARRWQGVGIRPAMRWPRLAGVENRPATRFQGKANARYPCAERGDRIETGGAAATPQRRGQGHGRKNSYPPNVLPISPAWGLPGLRRTHGARSVQRARYAETQRARRERRRERGRCVVETTGLRKAYMLGACQALGRVRTVLKNRSLSALVSGLHVSPVRFKDMKAFLATTCIVTGALLASGCATKKYVQNTAAPIQAKVDQVGEQTSRNGQQIEDTRSQVKQVDEKAQTGISAAQERASSADQHATTADEHAGAAWNRADQANQLGEKNTQALTSLRSVVANIDDYKLQTSVAVPFGFNKYELTGDAKTELDKLATDVKSDRRFFIAVEGYTDSTGSKAYNETLRRNRADRVVEYLVAKHDIPIYRIHMIGLGQEKPVDEARNRTARAKNRRVEVKVFSADQVTASLNGTDANSANRTQEEKK